ncbi:MAG TPA: hypothetical protein VFX50_09080, partial [Gemmatimonadales bacterium]|nr:hypothetical protein [Gemmatimonadales bacterium]
AVVDQMRAHVRAATALAIRRAATGRGGVARRMSAAQVGSLDGLEVIAHVAGEAAGSLRDADMATIRRAFELVEFARQCLGVEAAAGSRGHVLPMVTERSGARARCGSVDA